VQKEGSVGWREIEYKPVVVGDLTSVSMTYRTPIGPASASWTVKGGTITYDITVPVGAVATVTFPAVSAKENAKEMKAASGGIMSIEEGKSATVIKAGSGTYSFSGTLVQ
jgi:alpha-L-rhamnosidase